jgi:uncharacterized protein (TIGR03382 family)
MVTKQLCAVTGLAVALLVPSPARAWQVGTQLGYEGCHEPITAQALRNVRAMLATAPVIPPTRDEAALFADVQFIPPDDLIDDTGAMSLLLGVRDNDLKGANPLASLDVVQIHGDPDTQDEHCIRGPTDDGDPGQLAALEACRTFIRTRATEALAGLDVAGTVDATARMPLEVYVSIAGHVDPQLPVFWVRMGQALHALEDGFTHTYRTADGLRVTTVLNWIDFANGELDEGRDGPPHRMELDDCDAEDPLVVRNVAAATTAATELLRTALDPSLTEAQKIAGFDAVTAQYLTFEPGCDLANNWCDAPEAEVTAPGVGVLGCSAGGGDAGMLVVTGLLVLLVLRSRRSARGATTVVIGLVAAVVIAQAPVARAQPVPTPGPESPTAPAVPQTPPTTTPATADDPAVNPTVGTTEPGDTQDAIEGKEPGRDEKTPTVEEVAEVRDDKRLGSRFGFNVVIGASISRGAAVGAIGGRYRINEKWLVGLDVAWNPFITTAPLKMRAGVVEVYGTVIRRFPMRYDRVNLRTTLHAGTSTLLFDVYGAPKHSTGIFLAASVLGIDYDLGSAWRLVIDPAQMAVAVPNLTGIPLWYEQFRFMIGLQYGS